VKKVQVCEHPDTKCVAVDLCPRGHCTVPPPVEHIAPPKTSAPPVTTANENVRPTSFKLSPILPKRQ